LKYDREKCGNTEWISTDRFNKGDVPTGIAPYKMTEYQPGIRTVLQRNDKYYGAKPYYERVVLQSIPENGARIAALLSGSVDVIDAVPVNAIDQIDNNEKLQLISMPASRLIFFAFDQAGQPTPKIGGTNGANPFKDKRVREAINLGIDRAAIVDTIMDGIAEPSAGIVMANVFGSNPDLKVLPYDPKRARELLAQAGYPNGFEITISSPSDRYRNDAEVAQAVTQMLSQIGLKATLETVPQNVYFDRASKYEFSFFMGGASADSGEGLSQLLNLVHSRDAARGLGGANRGRYSSAAVDKYLDDALVTLDENARLGMLQKAQAEVYNDYGMVPLYHEVAVWAASKKVHFEPNAAQINIVYTARPAE
jgi:peptide/nickel transport system substrate-binding protein